MATGIRLDGWGAQVYRLVLASPKVYIPPGFSGRGNNQLEITSGRLPVRAAGSAPEIQSPPCRPPRELTERSAQTTLRNMALWRCFRVCWVEGDYCWVLCTEHKAKNGKKKTQPKMVLPSFVCHDLSSAGSAFRDDEKTPGQVTYATLCFELVPSGRPPPARLRNRRGGTQIGRGLIDQAAGPAPETRAREGDTGRMTLSACPKNPKKKHKKSQSSQICPQIVRR